MCQSLIIDLKVLTNIFSFKILGIVFCFLIELIRLSLSIGLIKFIYSSGVFLSIFKYQDMGVTYESLSYAVTFSTLLFLSIKMFFNHSFCLFI